MRGNVGIEQETQGQQQQACCGIHGCTSISVTHKAGGDAQSNVGLLSPAMNTDITLKNGAFKADMTALNPSCGISTTRKDDKGLQVTTRLVCKTGQGDWEFLLVNEGVIMLIDGQCVLVKRRKNNT